MERSLIKHQDAEQGNHILNITPTIEDTKYRVTLSARTRL